MKRTRGQSLLYAVLLMPTLMLILALAVDVAGLQMQQLRLRYAVDLATVAAATVVDTTSYSRTGRLQLDPVAAATTTREYLLRNLAPMSNAEQAVAVAASADIAVINQLPTVDPYTGRPLDRPAVCARIREPYRMSLLGWIGLGVVEVSVAADAEIRA